MAAALALAAILALATLGAGCAGKKSIPGYARPGEKPAESAETATQAEPFVTATNLPEGWGFVDALCFKGVGLDRHEPDTLFGCLVHARDKGTGTVKLPKGVYLGHVAEFIIDALKYYHIEEHFERFYGYRVVLVFRPATPEEVEERTNSDDSVRIGAGFAGEGALTLLGAPFVPIVAPVVFAFEAVNEDLEFQRFKRNAKALGLPEPTRRGDEITSRQYKDRYKRYWNAVAGPSDAQLPAQTTPNVCNLYVVERCYLAHPTNGTVNLTAQAPTRD